MRRVAWLLLLFFVFAIPWEYSLDLGAPLGNIARIGGVMLLLVAIPAILQAGEMRKPGPLQWLTLALFLWFCCTCFWSAVPAITLVKLRGYIQEMMVVWFVWEYAESPDDLRMLMRVWLAGSWVLAILTIANFVSFDPGSSDQIRFAAVGQDPNDVARFLDLGFPIAALLLDGRENKLGRLLAAGYLPLGFACVLLTASRGGFLAAIVALIGCAILLWRRHPRGAVGALLALPAIIGAMWLLTPRQTLERLGTIAEQLQTGDLNQRVNIWIAGWHAFVAAPLFGHGAGSFVTVAALAPTDTAHNTVLAILVEGGLCALAMATAIVAISLQSILTTRGGIRIALAALMAVWLMSSIVGTVGESRTTWLLLGIIAVGSRLAEEDPGGMERVFSDAGPATEFRLAERVT